MRPVLALCFLSLFAARGCSAQQARAQVAASATVVEGIGVAAGATEVVPSTHGTVDVTTPLSIRGSVPRVVQVVDADAPRPISVQLQPACADTRDAGAAPRPCTVRSRLARPEAGRESTVLTYQVATLN